MTNQPHAAENDAPQIEPKFTERQAKAWAEVACPILERHGVSTSLSPYSWTIQWSGSPQRGWHFNATYNDGETFAQVLMEVYGYPSVSVAELDWVHVDQDEELECETCGEEVTDV